MGRKLIALALCVLVLAGILPPGSAVGTPRVVFESGAADANGVFTVTMKVSDMTVRAIQFALKYDTSVIQPVDAKGNLAETFRDFAGVVQDWQEVVNEDLYADIGLFGSAWILPPSEEDQPFCNEYGDAVFGSEPVDVFTFRFKRLRAGDTGLEIATETKGAPYQDVLPEGLITINLFEEFPAEIIFREADDPDGGRTETHTPNVPAGPEKDPEELLQNVMVLQLGSHAAVVNGNVTAIYRGERDVTAYLRDNRTFVPVRFVGERLGATVDWDNETQTVTVEKDGHKVSMAVGSSTYYLDGEAKTLDAPAEFTPSSSGNPRTMVPIRFVSEALGYQVEWDQERYLVVIAPQSLGWDPKGAAEDQALTSAVTKLAMFSNFV